VSCTQLVSQTFVYMVISYGFFVLLYGFNKTKALLFVAIPALAWAVGNWFVFLVLGYEPWWYGLVRLLISLFENFQLPNR